MPITISELASRIGATLRGDGSATVINCAPLDTAGAESVSFYAHKKYTRQLETTRAAAIVISPKDVELANGRTLLISEDPYFTFREAVVLLHGFRERPAPGVSEHAIVDPSAHIDPTASVQAFVYIARGAKIGARSVIYPHCYIGEDSVVGEDCFLFPSVTLYDRCVIGNRVTLHAGTVIGQDGFGYATRNGVHHKIPQVGNAVVEDDVEMGANCAVDRGSIGTTVIGHGTKFSDLVAIGHGSNIGPYNLFVAQVGIAGSTTTGKYVVMGGQVGVAGHLNIADQVQIAAKSGVMNDLNETGETYGDTPALPLTEAKRTYLHYLRLPNLVADMKKLQKRVAELEEKLKDQPAE